MWLWNRKVAKYIMNMHELLQIQWPPLWRWCHQFVCRCFGVTIYMSKAGSQVKEWMWLDKSGRYLWMSGENKENTVIFTISVLHSAVDDQIINITNQIYSMWIISNYPFIGWIVHLATISLIWQLFNKQFHTSHSSCDPLLSVLELWNYCLSMSEYCLTWFITITT